MSIKDVINMNGPHHICVLYVATAGLQGALMGSDEQEIVLLIYVIVDVVQNKVIGVQQYPIRPQTADSNDNILSEQILNESGLTDDIIKSAGRQLEDALKEFHEYCAALHLDPSQTNSFRFITDGQLPLRQCLHPEACRKDMNLDQCYNVFHDLRKEVAKSLGKMEEMPQTIAEMLDLLELKQELENEFYKKEAKDMVNILQRLITDGHRFDAPETVTLILEPGICSKDDEIDSNCVVRARGLPWQSSDQDIAKFFRGLNVAKGGVALCLSAAGRRNGEALIRFINQEHRDMALKRHKHHIGTRYIEVYRATGNDFLSVAGGSNCEAQAFLSRGAAVIVRMRGLPYDCTGKQVLDFFASGESSCTVLDGVDGVLFVRKPDGRATGDAFVLFANETDAPKALSKHRECIGSRYIELFRSTTAEVQQVLNRTLDPKPQFEAPILSTLPPVPLLPQHIITSGTRKDCIRLRGLPYEAQVEHILDFLGDFAKNIVFQGVHMVFNAQGQPSGEAFIQMDTEQSAYITAQQKHHRYMIFGKKQRYIEVFQCSGDDMNLVLTGGMPAPVSPANVAAAAAAAKATPTLLSPGMLASPLPPTNIPPPPPLPHNSATSAANNGAVSNAAQANLVSNVAPPSAHWENPALFAQQQAQIIAQQSLLARQNQNEMLLMNQIAQHNLSLFNQQQQQHGGATAGPLSPNNAGLLMKGPPPHQPGGPMMSHLLPHHQQFIVLPPRMPHLGLQRAPLQYPPHLLGHSANVMSVVPHVAMKRSYGDAFNEQSTPAKRVYQAAAAAAAAAQGVLPMYQSFYPNI